MHGREDIAVVGGAAEHEAIHTERILNCLRHVVTTKVGDGHLAGILGFQYFRKLFRSLCCITVNGSVSYQHTVCLYAVSAPDGIEAQRLVLLGAFEHRSV